jgi:hypothetical protein
MTASSSVGWTWQILWRQLVLVVVVFLLLLMVLLVLPAIEGNVIL